MPKLIAKGYNPTAGIVFSDDPSFTIWHRALHRFYKYADRTVANGGTVSSQLEGQTADMVAAGGTIQIGPTTKGAVIPTGTARRFEMPAAYNFANLPTDRDIIVSTAFTVLADTAAGTGERNIIGRALTTGASQWHLYQAQDGPLLLRLQSGASQIALTTAKVNDGVRRTVTLHFKAGSTAAPTVRTVDAYVGTTLIASTSFTVTDNASWINAIGSINISGVAHTMHSTQLFTPPKGYDPTAWIAAEVAKINADIA